MDPVRSRDYDLSHESRFSAHLLMWSHLIVFLSLGAFVAFVWLNGPLLTTALQIAFLGLLMISPWRITAPLLLALIQADLLFREPARPAFVFAPDTYVPVLTIVVLLMFCSRYHAFSSEISGGIPVRLARLLRYLASPTVGPTETSVGLRRTVLGWLRSTLTALTLLLAVCAASGKLLEILPPRNSPRAWWISESGFADMIWPGAWPLVILMGLFALCSELNWRQLTARQAGMYGQSILVSLLYADIRMFVLRTLRQQKRAHRKNAGNTPPVTVTQPAPLARSEQAVNSIHSAETPETRKPER